MGGRNWFFGPRPLWLHCKITVIIVIAVRNLGQHLRIPCPIICLFCFAIPIVIFRTPSAVLACRTSVGPPTNLEYSQKRLPCAFGDRFVTIRFFKVAWPIRVAERARSPPSLPVSVFCYNVIVCCCVFLIITMQSLFSSISVNRSSSLSEKDTIIRWVPMLKYGIKNWIAILGG